MKITKLQTFFVNPTGKSRNWIFIKIHTDEGVHGVGEAFNTGKDKATKAVINSFGRYLVGKDPTKILHHWQALFRSSRFPLGTVSMGALSGVEHALWDIAGKKYGQPVYKLLGGPSREKVRVYTHVHGDTPEELADHAQALIKQGFTALKLGPHPPHYAQIRRNKLFREAYKRVIAVREAVGEEIDLCLDYLSIDLSPANAIKMAKMLEPLHPFFLEEPVLFENIDAMVEVKKNTIIPIATGERLFTRYGFRELLEKRAVDIIQPDPIVCGGIWESLKIASMAETYYVSLAPHNPFGPIATAVCVQIAACATNFLILEYLPDTTSPRNEIVPNPLKIQGGYLEIPQDPGLGVELNENAIQRYPYAPWDRHVVLHPNGSVGQGESM